MAWDALKFQVKSYAFWDLSSLPCPCHTQGITLALHFKRDVPILQEGHISLFFRLSWPTLSEGHFLSHHR
jgi:hypothetical protein